ncbi:MAG: hypothetical protein KAQ92_03605 [Candidatus Aenigmarchaeota archaeon]|nr:hypothetical protein [Candidatus Aenigmarchaeota archaeon]
MRITAASPDLNNKTRRFYKKELLQKFAEPGCEFKLHSLKEKNGLANFKISYPVKLTKQQSEALKQFKDSNKDSNKQQLETLKKQQSEELEALKKQQKALNKKEELKVLNKNQLKALEKEEKYGVKIKASHPDLKIDIEYDIYKKGEFLKNPLTPVLKENERLLSEVS